MRRFYQTDYSAAVKYISTIIALLIALTALTGCNRARPTKKSPIHINPNMDYQQRFEAQEASEFFADGAAMRTPVAGTIPRGFLRDDEAYFTGKTGPNPDDYLQNIPEEITIQFLERGRERYDIYCSPCHSRLGDGRGIMIQRGYVPPPTFHSERIRTLADGYIYDVITAGVRNMPGYANQIPPRDRWAIVAYVRALQLAQNAREDDVPEELRDKIKQAGQ